MAVPPPQAPLGSGLHNPRGVQTLQSSRRQAKGSARAASWCRCAPLGLGGRDSTGLLPGLCPWTNWCSHHCLLSFFFLGSACVLTLTWRSSCVVHVFGCSTTLEFFPNGALGPLCTALWREAAVHCRTALAAAGERCCAAASERAYNSQIHVVWL